MPTNPLLAAPPVVYPNFGKWLTYAESIKSQTAIRKGIANVPTPEQYQNMRGVYLSIFQPLCEHFGKKLPVTSFFRSVALNKAVGGSATSAHCLGMAIDIDCDGLVGGPTNKELFWYVAEKMTFDQVIAESPRLEDNVPQWIHIGFKPVGNRNERLKMEWKKGKQIYTHV